MKVITRHILARGAAKSWRETFCHEGEWEDPLSPRRGPYEEIYKKLLALGNSPTPEEVIEVIGSPNCLSYRCSECNAKSLPSALLGWDEYEGGRIVCFKCLKLASIALEGHLTESK